ncbi:MAG: branched-chain amino acid ABC transporter permease [Ectothiorhodospiraceae bacterium AqS1]|nr:branched-chain amino acid ABC transporter permease [Ectothiorhodospiraceae bacterium AqS1]
MEWLNAIVQGALLGGLFALFATGLSLIFGVMRLVNLAHGDLIVLAAFLAIAVVEAFGVHPLATLVVVVPAMFVLGFVLQSRLLDFTLGDDILPPLLVTFGLSIIIQNVLLESFSADTRRLQAAGLETASVELAGGIAVGVYPLLVFVIAVLVIASLQALFYRTHLGRVFRATSDDRDTVRLMGVDNRRVFALAMGIALGVCALAGVLMAIRTNITPTVGPARLLYAFEAVIIGGLGNLWGTLAGGIILGVAQSLGAKIHPGFQVLAGHIVFLAILALRPKGLFPKIQG